MNQLEIELFKKAKKDFQRFQKSKHFTSFQEKKLLTYLTGLLGWYNTRPDPRLRNLIEKMLSFAETKKWDISGPRIQFEYIKKKHHST